MLTTTEIILAIANIVLIIVAVFLFVRLRKLGKKGEPKKEEKSDLTGIADIAPKEFKPERFELKPQDIIPTKTEARLFDSGAESKRVILEKAQLKLEDELPEIEVTPVKKSKKKKPATKETEGVVKKVIKEVTEVTPVKKSKKKKPATKETEEIVKEVIKEIEAAPEKIGSEKMTVSVQEEPEVATELVQEDASVKPTSSVMNQQTESVKENVKEKS